MDNIDFTYKIDVTVELFLVMIPLSWGFCGTVYSK